MCEAITKSGNVCRKPAKYWVQMSPMSNNLMVCGIHLAVTVDRFNKSREHVAPRVLITVKTLSTRGKSPWR